VLVETLLARGGKDDSAEAEAATDRLAALPTNVIPAAREITVLRSRALVARARADESTYRDYRHRYRAMATELGFEGHMKWAKAMP
jgi:adenylate cyclase